MQCVSFALNKDLTFILQNGGGVLANVPDKDGVVPMTIAAINGAFSVRI